MLKLPWWRSQCCNPNLTLLGRTIVRYRSAYLKESQTKIQHYALLVVYIHQHRFVFLLASECIHEWNRRGAGGGRDGSEREKGRELD